MKLILDADFLEETYTLIAIHSGVEAYKLAYLLNERLNFRLKRRRTDLDLNVKKQTLRFPIFDFEEVKTDTVYYLAVNSSTVSIPSPVAGKDLFSESEPMAFQTHYLLPEFKKTEYLLKIEPDLNPEQKTAVIAEINRIEEVLTAYEIIPGQIRSKNNIIFY